MTVYAEIPFIDGPEAAFIKTLTGEKGIIRSDLWIEQRKFMLMIHIDDWSEIRKAWYAACRIAGPKCNVHVDSIDQVVHQLLNVIGKMSEGSMTLQKPSLLRTQ